MLITGELDSRSTKLRCCCCSLPVQRSRHIWWVASQWLCMPACGMSIYGAWPHESPGSEVAPVSLRPLTPLTPEASPTKESWNTKDKGHETSEEQLWPYRWQWGIRLEDNVAIFVRCAIYIERLWKWDIIIFFRICPLLSYECYLVVCLDM